MLVLRRLPRLPLNPPAQKRVAAIGIFDGVHRGHRAILRRASIAITFDPHPLKVLRPAIAPPMLMPLHGRLEAISRCGIRTVWVIPFTRSFSRWSPQRFVRDLLVRRLGVRKVVVGRGFRFGAGRRGSVQTLRRLGGYYGFEVRTVAPVRFQGERVSSGKLRGWIRQGKLGRARRLLGGPAAAIGRVTRGSGRGRKLGFATANVKVKSGLLPPAGVYAVRAAVDGRWHRGMANIGFRPTFRKRVPGLRPGTQPLTPRGQTSPGLEVHLFGFSSPLYGQQLEVEFIRRLRRERRFASPEALARQLAIDARRARWYTGPEDGRS